MKDKIFVCNFLPNFPNRKLTSYDQVFTREVILEYARHVLLSIGLMKGSMLNVKSKSKADLI